MSVVINPTVATIGRSVTARYFGTGDGSRTVFNLAGLDSDRAYLTPSIYLDQTLQTVTTHYTVDATGKVSFVTAPAVGKVVNYLDPHVPSGEVYRAFGVGDGTSMGFSLPFVPKVPVVYRKDWQGNQLLYSTARTNYQIHSGRSDLVFSGAGVSWSANTTETTAPNGSQTADKLIVVAGGVVNITGTNITAPVTGAMTYWLDVKKGTEATIIPSLRDSTTSTDYRFRFNFDTLAIDLKDAGVTTFTPIYLGNGWYRIGLTASGYSIGNIILPYLTRAQNYSVGGYTYIGEVQVEVGSIATNYIPTTTAPVTVTDYAYTPDGEVTLAVAPTAGAILTADMNMGPTP